MSRTYRSGKTQWKRFIERNGRRKGYGGVADSMTRGRTEASGMEAIEREYLVQPKAGSWNVKGDEALEYYDDAPKMEVGDVYENSAYSLVRTKNMRGRRHRR